MNGHIDFKLPVCKSCGNGHLAKCTQVGRGLVVNVNGRTIKVPDDMALPTCSSCYAVALDERMLQTLDLVIDPEDEDSVPMSRSIDELLVKEMDLHPPTNRAEVQRQYIVLMGKFRASHGLTSRSEIEEAIRSHLINDHALLEEWILMRQAMDALQLEQYECPEIPDRIVLDDVTFAKFTELINNPKPPTLALIELFKKTNDNNDE